MEPTAELIHPLLAWLPAQRWFAGKGRPLDTLHIEQQTPIDDTTWHLLLNVQYTDGAAERYQVPVCLRTEPAPEYDHHRIGETSDGFVYDALQLPEGTAALYELLRGGRTASGLSTTAVQDLEDLSGLPLGVEQSNTSVVYGDAYILKVFRRVAPGVNPDLEVTRALAQAGSTHVAAPVAWFEGTLDGEATTFGVLQEFLRSGTDGWRMALTSVRDLYAEADLHADEVGGDFAGEAERLGGATAEVHALLAEVLESRTATSEEIAATASRMSERLDAAVRAVDALRPYEDGLREAFDAFASLTEPVPVQRIHGDYHLGQVLRGDRAWVLLDFEGEPAKSRDERVSLDSPLRDVAGMLRSFDYAARYLLLEREDSATLAYRADEWARRNRDAFCDGYATASGADPRSSDVLLRAYELDKAVYEVMYEARHRPNWLSIPLAAVQRLVG